MSDQLSDRMTLPDKLYFRIGEVSHLAGVPTYVLRFWETEFKKIKPKRTPSGQRLYRKDDVALILQIRHLLYEKKFTIQGAKQYLKAARKNLTPGIDEIEDIRRELEHIRHILGE